MRFGAVTVLACRVRFHTFLHAGNAGLEAVCFARHGVDVFIVYEKEEFVVDLLGADEVIEGEHVACLQGDVRIKHSEGRIAVYIGGANGGAMHNYGQDGTLIDGEYYGGGGGSANASFLGNGGKGGGGSGAPDGYTSGYDGTANTGGGGGGAAYQTSGIGGSGGSGVVIILIDK